MGKKRSELHHWWPKGVSKRWADEAGGVHWLRPDGTDIAGRPDGFGAIRNGHYVKLAATPGQASPFDQNFEDEFQAADDRFPGVIDWLESLDFVAKTNGSRRCRFVSQPSTDRQFGDLVESLVSLAVRSPMTRHCAVSVADRLRGHIDTWERNGLIGLNLRDMHRRITRSLGCRGKATAILSPGREFIFGDGFYHNLITPDPPHSARILTPLTPRLAVLYAMPLRYSKEPRLSTLVIEPQEADELNAAVQVYARDALFYRSERPVLSEAFQSGKHLRWASSRNIVENMVHDMPGVPDRDTSLDFLEDQMLARRN